MAIEWVIQQGMNVPEEIRRNIQKLLETEGLEPERLLQITIRPPPWWSQIWICVAYICRNCGSFPAEADVKHIVEPPSGAMDLDIHRTFRSAILWCSNCGALWLRRHFTF